MNGCERHHLVLYGSLVLAALAGCQEYSSRSSPSSSPRPTEVVSIFVGGQCLVASSTIVCRDASRSEPLNRLSSVSWQLVDVLTGSSQGNENSAPGGEVSFIGLATATYQVNQTVFAQDGSSRSRTYGPLTVGSL